ncbi:MAG: hypothetical protein LBU70_08780, partial [Chitinispirillales bacterium]|nr:hypothetical protein [Chitinispirillales bacterium]
MGRRSRFLGAILHVLLIQRSLFEAYFSISESELTGITGSDIITNPQKIKMVDIVIHKYYYYVWMCTLGCVWLLQAQDVVDCEVG